QKNIPGLHCHFHFRFTVGRYGDGTPVTITQSTTYLARYEPAGADLPGDRAHIPGNWRGSKRLSRHGAGQRYFPARRTHPSDQPDQRLGLTGLGSRQSGRRIDSASITVLALAISSERRIGIAITYPGCLGITQNAICGERWTIRLARW